jgi:hypothetical protein
MRAIGGGQFSQMRPQGIFGDPGMRLAVKSDREWSFGGRFEYVAS